MNGTIPPKKDAKDSERTYRTALNSRYYLLLERESLERGTTPYRLTQGIVTAYLTGQLIYKDELPEAIQAAIEKYKKISPGLTGGETLAGAEPSEPV